MATSGVLNTSVLVFLFCCVQLTVEFLGLMDELIICHVNPNISFSYWLSLYGRNTTENFEDHT